METEVMEVAKSTLVGLDWAVIAVYFGAVGIRRTRHALPAALCADAAGMLAAVAICNLWF